MPGTFVYTPPAGTVLNAGAGQTLSVTFTPTDTTTYSTGTKTVTIDVTKATPVVTWASPAAIVYGTALSATQLNATASVPGTFAYNPLAGTVLGAGTGQVLSVTFTPSDATNFTTGTKTVTIDVTAATPSVTSLTANRPFPSPAGTSITWTATATGGIAPLQYQFWLDVPGSGWTLVQGYGPSASVTWTPSFGGTHRIQVWVRRSGSTALYDAYSNVVSFSVTGPAPLVVTGPTPSVTLPATAGTPMMWTATATGGAAPLQYQFWLDVPGTGWTLLRGYGPSASVAWTPSFGGAHRIQVWVRNNGSTTTYDAYSSVVSFSVTGPAPLIVTSPTATAGGNPVTFPATTGTPLTWTATSTGGGPPTQYVFWIDVPGTGWMLCQGYSAANTTSPWTPTVAGTYRIQVWAKNSGSTALYDAYSSVVSFSVTGPAQPAFASVTPSTMTRVSVGAPTTGSATSRKGPAQVRQ